MLAALLVGISLSLLVYVLVGVRRAPLVPGRRSVVGLLEGNLSAIRLLRVLVPLTERLAPLGDLVAIPSLRHWIALTIRGAGLKQALTVNHVLAASSLSMAVLPATAAVAGMRSPLLLCALAAGGLLLPVVMLRDLRRHREQEVVLRLAGAVDVLSLSVGAGLDFLGALRRVVERGAPGPLRDEFAVVLQDIRLGQTRVDALKTMTERVPVKEVREFCGVLVQADLLGASIEHTLRSLAARLRAERFQRAERAGAQAAHKLRVPLMLFIFPAVLLLILAIALGPFAVELL